MKTTAIALAMTLGFAGAAQAAVSDISTSLANSGTPSTGYDAIFGSAVKSSFMDFYTFTIPLGAGTSGGASVIAGFNKKGMSNVNISEFELEDVTGYTNAQIASDMENPYIVETFPKSNSGNFSFFGLNPAHTYALEVMGNLTSGNTHGSYAGNVSIDPVPEPSEYALMATGLGLFGFIATRRSKKAA